jgi:tetratricopeptide (TPR) repeat protein
VTEHTGSQVAGSTTENVDLDEDRKQEILTLDHILDGLNHFEVLGLLPGASTTEVKKAYHEASRRYHPDRFFQRNLGSFRPRIERIFRRISEANAVLSDSVRRQEYERANPALSTPAATPPAPMGPDDEKRSAERRARLARHPYLIRKARLTQLLANGKKSLLAGDFGKAYTDLHLASQIDPKNQEVHVLLRAVRHKHELERASRELKLGQDAEKGGDLATAARSYLNAANIDRRSALAASKAAALLRKTGHELKEVRLLAQRAVELEPTNPDHRLLLVSVLEDMGMQKLAARQLAEALKLNPDHPELKKRNKSQKKSLWPF